MQDLVDRQRRLGLQPRVEVGDVRLEGAYPDTELVLPVLAARHGPGEIRDRLWRVPEGGGKPVWNVDGLDLHVILRELAG